jgi:ubiquinone/menaquinone biosynthesis C-methylase UbiE
MNVTEEQENNVSAAFTAQSSKFDAQTTGNPMEVFYRDITRNHVLSFIQKGQTMLELNCGTGLDAMFFARQGLKVHATDNSDGMLNELRIKLDSENLNGSVTYQKCSFQSLNPVLKENKYDHVFSNYGGLNCAEDLAQVIKQVDAHVKPGGMVHFVMIAPVCFWEWITVFKGKFKFAFRRLTKKGLRSHLEGHYFDTYYYSAAYVQKAFGKNYAVVKMRALGFFTPPTFNHYFPTKHPVLFKVLKQLELTLNGLWPFNRTGDLYIISLKKSDKG